MCGRVCGLTNPIAGSAARHRGRSRAGRVRAACHAGLYAAAILDGQFQDAGTQILLVFYSSPELAMKVFPDVAERGFRPKWRDIDRDCEEEAEAIRSQGYVGQRVAYAGAAVGLTVLSVLARRATGAGVIANAATNVSKDGIQGNKLEELEQKCKERRLERVAEVAALGLGL